MSKIKMLIVSTTGLPRKEGISTIIMDYLSHFNKSRFKFDILAPGECDEELVKAFTKEGFNVQYVPSRKEQAIRYYCALYELCRKGKYDILYIHGSSAIMFFELFIARICGCKVRVVHSHNTTCRHMKLDKVLRPLFYKSYTCALACGQEAGKWLYGRHPFQVIKNGRDVNRYRFDSNARARIRTKLGLTEETLAVGHVGNFNSFKNQSFLVNVFAHLLKHKQNAQLYLIGDGILVDKIKQQVIESGLRDYVIFMGSIPDVNDMLQGLDVMVLPSVHEGLPLAVVEWQIAALPCLVSDRVTKECAYTELVHFKSLNDSLEEWAEQLIEIADVDRKNLSEHVIIETEKNGFDINKSALVLEHIFEKLIQR